MLKNKMKKILCGVAICVTVCSQVIFPQAVFAATKKAVEKAGEEFVAAMEADADESAEVSSENVDTDVSAEESADNSERGTEWTNRGRTESADCGFRPAVRGKSLCLWRDKPDKRCGLLRICNVCVCTVWIFFTKGGSRPVLSVCSEVSSGSGAGRPGILWKRNQPCSAVHRRRTDYPRQHVRIGNKDFQL